MPVLESVTGWGDREVNGIISKGPLVRRQISIAQALASDVPILTEQEIVEMRGVQFYVAKIGEEGEAMLMLTPAGKVKIFGKPTALKGT